MKSHAITVNGEEYNVMEGETITIKDWEQTLHRQVFFFDDGIFEETRG